MGSLEDRVYKNLLKVPKGRVTTYKELADSVGLKNGQRAVGCMMKKNPLPIVVPCHRVVKSDGSLGGYAYGEVMKKRLLSKEGVVVKKRRIENWDETLFRF